MLENGLIRKLRLISKLMVSQTGKRIITIHISTYISRSKGNQTIKTQKSKKQQKTQKRSGTSLLPLISAWFGCFPDCDVKNFAINLSFIIFSDLQEIRSSNPPAVTGICDPKKSRARHHHSLKLGSKLKHLNIDQLLLS